MAVSKQNNGVGRRKTSVARVYISKKSGDAGRIVINKRPLEAYFSGESMRQMVISPLAVVDMLDQFDIVVNVHGGGTAGQAGAIRHGLTRALLQYDEEGDTGGEGGAQGFRSLLRKAGFVTRDARAVERKKVGLHKARKRPQFSKR